MRVQTEQFFGLRLHRRLNRATLAAFVGRLNPPIAGPPRVTEGLKTLATRADAIITAGLRPELFAERGVVGTGPAATLRTVIVRGLQFFSERARRGPERR